MSSIKWRVEHAEALDLIAYGLAKFAGPTLGTNEIANYIAGSRSAFLRSLVDKGLAKSTGAISNRQDNYDPFFGPKKGYYQKTKEHAPRKERLDAVVGKLNMEQYAAFIEAIIADEMGNAVDDSMHQLIIRAKRALSDFSNVSSTDNATNGTLPPVEEHKKTVEMKKEAQDSDRQHIEVQWVLKQLGFISGCQVYIASNDGSQFYHGEPLNKDCIDSLPRKGVTGSLYKRLSYIDVIWVQNKKIICAFEVECSTSIYSGILRISDLVYSMPYDKIKGYIIVPEARKGKVIEQLKRPTFSNEHIQGFIRYMTIEELKELYSHFAALDLKPGSINTEVLEQKAHIVECENDE